MNEKLFRKVRDFHYLLHISRIPRFGRVIT